MTSYGHHGAMAPEEVRQGKRSQLADHVCLYLAVTLGDVPGLKCSSHGSLKPKRANLALQGEPEDESRANHRL